MSDTPRTDAFELDMAKMGSKEHSAWAKKMRELERELAAAECELANRANVMDMVVKLRAELAAVTKQMLAYRGQLAAMTLERNEARECLREAIAQNEYEAPHEAIDQLNRWRKAAGMDQR